MIPSIGRRPHAVSPIVALLLAGLAIGTGAAWAAPNPLGPSRPLKLVADEVTVDNEGTGLVARGHVRVAYGADQATADRLHLLRSSQTAVLSGHVQVAGSEGRAQADAVTLYLSNVNQIIRVVMTGGAVVEGKEYALSADLIDADRSAGRLTAQGHVSGFAAPDLIVTGERITYDQRTQHAVVTGHPVVSNRAGRLEGDWLELFQAHHRALVHGPVVAEVYGATIRSDGATVEFTRAAAVFTGHVVADRRQGTLWAERLTIYYEARRIVAEGAPRLRFFEAQEAASP